MDNESFIKELNQLNIHLTLKQLNQLEKYYELLIKWNQNINLTAITDKKEVYLKHFYDSLTLSKIIDLNKNIKMCDIGTGAGFPGIVLKIVFPNIDMTLVDSLNKRIKFLDEVIDQLNLEKIETVHARIEDYSKDNKEKFDIVTARAVAHLSIILELSSQMIKVNGNFVAMKANIKDEIEESKLAIKKLGFQLEEKESFLLPFENSNRNLLKLKKIDKTNLKYPRKFSEIKKNRL